MERNDEVKWTENGLKWNGLYMELGFLNLGPGDGSEVQPLLRVPAWLWRQVPNLELWRLLILQRSTWINRINHEEIRNPVVSSTHRQEPCWIMLNPLKGHLRAIADFFCINGDPNPRSDWQVIPVIHSNQVVSPNIFSHPIPQYSAVPKWSYICANP